MENQTEKIFKELSKILSSFKKDMKVSTDGKKKFALYGKKKVTAYNKEFDGMYFSSMELRKDYVVLYYFAQYSNPKLLAQMPAGLKKCLKGKSCFHFKKYDAELFSELKKYIKLGYEGYKQLGWI